MAGREPGPGFGHPALNTAGAARRRFRLVAIHGPRHASEQALLPPSLGLRSLIEPHPLRQQHDVCRLAAVGKPGGNGKGLVAADRSDGRLGGDDAVADNVETRRRGVAPVPAQRSGIGQYGYASMIMAVSVLLASSTRSGSPLSNAPLRNPPTSPTVPASGWRIHRSVA